MTFSDVFCIFLGQEMVKGRPRAYALRAICMASVYSCYRHCYFKLLPVYYRYSALKTEGASNELSYKKEAQFLYFQND